MVAEDDGASGSVLLDLVMPILGNILAITMSLSPGPVIYHAYKRDSLGTFNVYPNALLFINSVAWCIYANIVDAYLIYIPNAFASVVTLLFALVCHELATTRQRRYVEYIIVGGALILFLNAGLVGFVISSPEARAQVFGYTCNVVLFVFYASPATLLVTVVRTRNASSFSLPVAIASTANSCCWAAYGVGVADPFVWLPNGVGLLIGLMQLVCIGVFWKNRHMPPPPTVAPSSMHLQLPDVDEEDDEKV